jgi:hypothetical protein
VVGITVVAIVPDTLRIGPVIPATARAILAMVVRQVIPPAVVRLVVLLLQLFLQARALVRTPQVALPVRGPAEGRRLLCRPPKGTVRTPLPVSDPVRMKPAVINVHRPLTLALRKPIVRMHFPDPWGDVRRARGETKVWQPRAAGEVASGANSYESRVGALAPESLVGAMKE